MTLQQFVGDARLLRRLVGEECIRASAGYADTLLLDFHVLHPPDEKGHREPDKALTVECPWRLESATGVIVGWHDKSEVIDSRLPVLVGKRVVRTRVYRPSYMVRIDFTDDLAVWIFPDDSQDYATEAEYPHTCWYVTGRAIPHSP